MRHWILVKGMKQDQRHWRDLPDRVAEAFGGEVVCLDLPGAGTEAHRRAPTRVEALAADLRRRWRAEASDVDGPWGLLGLSLGGMVALSWASQWPEDLAGVVVGNTSSRDTARLHWRLRPPSLARAMRSSFVADPVRRERAVIDLISAVRTPEERQDLAHRYARFQAEQPFRPASLARQLAAGGRFRAPKRVDIPLRVLVGARDHFVDPRATRAIAHHLGAPVVEHPDAGHDLGLDAPDWLLQSLLDFAADHADQSTAPPGRK